MKINKKVLLVAILIALIVTGVTYIYINYLANSKYDSSEYIRVVTAIDDIPSYVKITKSMLSYELLPSEYVNEEAIQSMEDVEGKMANTKLIKGEQVLLSRISENTDSANLAYRVDENMRAITIPVTEVTGLAGNLKAGDKVDLLIGYTDNIGAGGEGIYTQLQNIKVIAVGNSVEVNSTSYNSITLMVNPSQAELVAYAALHAYIHCTLRNPSDDLKVNLNMFGAQNFDTWNTR